MIVVYLALINIFIMKLVNVEKTLFEKDNNVSMG